MKQSIKKSIKAVKSQKSNTNGKINKKSTNNKRPYKHPKYGTSKLEKDFAAEFLDKLGIEYVYQYEAKDIGRFYDFYLPKSNLLIEIDGSYYHSDPRVVEKEKINQMQKRNKRVDELKDRWASLNCIPLMRIWEYDIRNNKEMVMKMLRDRLYIEDKKVILKENKKKRGKPKKNTENQ